MSLLVKCIFIIVTTTMLLPFYNPFIVLITLCTKQLKEQWQLKWLYKLNKQMTVADSLDNYIVNDIVFKTILVVRLMADIVIEYL